MGIRKLVDAKSDMCHPREKTTFYGRQILGPVGHYEAKYFDDGTVIRQCDQTRSGLCDITGHMCKKGDDTTRPSSNLRHSVEYNIAIGSIIKLRCDDLNQLIPSQAEVEVLGGETTFVVMEAATSQFGNRIYTLRLKGNDQMLFSMNVRKDVRRFPTLEVTDYRQSR